MVSAVEIRGENNEILLKLVVKRSSFSLLGVSL